MNKNDCPFCMLKMDNALVKSMIQHDLISTKGVLYSCSDHFKLFVSMRDLII